MKTFAEQRGGMEGEFMAFDDPASKFKDGKNHALHAAKEMKAAAMEMKSAAKELKEATMLKARELKDTAMNRFSGTRRRMEGSMRQMQSKYQQQTRQSPLGTLVAAFGVGMLLGFVLRRR